MAWYLDSSALTKIVATEAETSSLAAWMHTVEASAGFIVSDLVAAECLRAARRQSAVAAVHAQAVLARFPMVGLSRSTFKLSWSIGDPFLRTLDALHLARVLELGDSVDGLVCYDQRLAQAATALGLTVVAPGASTI